MQSVGKASALLSKQSDAARNTIVPDVDKSFTTERQLGIIALPSTAPHAARYIIAALDSRPAANHSLVRNAKRSTSRPTEPETVAECLLVSAVEKNLRRDKPQQSSAGRSIVLYARRRIST